MIVIVCDDSKSAPRYFAALNQLFPQVVLRLPGGRTNETSPRQVVSRAAAELGSERDVGDAAWAVFDAEPQAGHRFRNQLRVACRDAERAGVAVAISNPCFEHWLHLHLEDCDGGCHRAAEKVELFSKDWSKHRCGGDYAKGSADFRLLATPERVRDARDRARKQLRAKGSRPEDCPPCATDLFRLIESIEAIVKEL